MISWISSVVDPCRGQGLCGFNKAWSMLVLSLVKSLATPSFTKLDRNSGFYFRLFIVLIPSHKESKFLTRDLTTMDHHFLKPLSPDRQGSAANEIPNNLISTSS